MLFGAFLWNQAHTRNEPLVPLSLFADRNFAMANIGIAAVGCAVTSMSLPMMFFAQLGRGLSPTQAALLTAPSAVLSGVLAPFAGRLLDRTDPRFILLPGLILVAGAMTWWGLWMNVDTPIWAFLFPAAMMGVGQAGMWGPLSTTANRNLPPRLAGAGAGVYNTTRQIGSVIGSAAIAALMQSRLTALMPAGQDGLAGAAHGGLPPQAAAPFSLAMGQAMLLPVCVLGVAIVAASFMERPSVLARR
ncbi:MFS transporter [Propioniciclava coleopterorum]|uniref:MFS transporter n=1 Tax=Propioniciclava coleopterorum TaxID=2714937 RepID=UPI001FEB555F|nr:MFS transporter [Propioniciclava coleopterorum]